MKLSPTQRALLEALADGRSHLRVAPGRGVAALVKVTLHRSGLSPQRVRPATYQRLRLLGLLAVRTKKRSRYGRTLGLSERGVREVALFALDAEYERVRRRVVKQMQVANVDALRSGDDVLQAGVRVANRAARSGGQAAAEDRHAVELSSKPLGQRKPSPRRRE